MTIREVCRCGAEFYLSMSEETDAVKVWASSQYDKFRKVHNGCCSIEEEELPEDWKL